VFDSTSRLGKLGQPRGTNTWGWNEWTLRGSPRATAPARERACHEKKRMEVEASLPARIEESRVQLPARRSAVAEVVRRRLASNKLGKRAPKRAVRVE
jgi:hypothetical protein